MPGFGSRRTKNFDIHLKRLGIIKGTIFDAVTGQPIPELTVEAKLINLDSEYEDGKYGYYQQPYSSKPYYAYETFPSTPSDENGHYIFNGLIPGSYRLFVSANNHYLTQYYSLTNNQQEPAIIDLEADQVIEHIDFYLTKGIGLEGSVLDASTGEPLSGKFYVSLLNEKQIQIKRTYLNNEGKYTFTNITPGSYFIKVDNYSSEGYYSGWHQPDGSDPATPTPVYISQSVSGIDIYLAPKASISGQVYDELSQKPLSGMYVMVAPSNCLHYYTIDEKIIKYYIKLPEVFARFSAKTDEYGRYTVSNLTEGDYGILVVDPALVYTGEYYDNVSLTDWKQATVIHLNPSEVKTGIDFQLQVKTTEPETGETADQVQATVTTEKKARPNSLWSPFFAFYPIDLFTSTNHWLKPLSNNRSSEWPFGWYQGLWTLRGGNNLNNRTLPYFNPFLNDSWVSNGL